MVGLDGYEKRIGWWLRMVVAKFSWMRGQILKRRVAPTALGAWFGAVYPALPGWIEAAVNFVNGVSRWLLCGTGGLGKAVTENGSGRVRLRGVSHLRRSESIHVGYPALPGWARLSAPTALGVGEGSTSLLLLPPSR